MTQNRIRTKAICVFRNAQQILVAEGYDANHQLFYVPLGGAIHFGEYSQDTLVREIREEIGAEITHLQYLGLLEHIFTFSSGKPGHEIVLVYDGEFVDQSLYAKEYLNGYEKEDNWGAFRAVWKELSDFQRDQPPLRPDGLFELLCQLE